MNTPTPAGSGASGVQRGPEFVHSLAKGLEILSLFSEGDMLGNQQLAELTGMPKATVSRLTATLVQLGYLRTGGQSRKLFMGSRVLGMGATVQRKIGLQRTARPHMEALSQALSLTVSMGTRDRLGMTMLEVVRPATTLVANFDVGTILPLATTSIGLAYIVAAPVKERATLLEGMRDRDPEQWPAMRAQIERAHAEYKRYGFVTSQKSWGRDVSGVGVALSVGEKKSLYVFNCAGQTTQMPMIRMRNDIGPGLLDMVRKIDAAMHEAPRTRLVIDRVHEP